MFRLSSLQQKKRKKRKKERNNREFFNTLGGRMDFWLLSKRFCMNEFLMETEL